jgi:large subunit ribosomal protein L6
VGGSILITMSLIGKKPIKLDKDVKADIGEDSITISGPKGELIVPVRREVKVEQKEDLLKVSVKNESNANAKAYHGLTRSLLANAVEGVLKGYKKELELVGMGYRVKKEGKDLKFALGLSHPVMYTPPEGIELEAPEQTKIIVSGIDKYLVGQVSASIRALKKPEPYKGKGIRYSGETVKLKAGKAGKVGGGAPGD